jgi:colicin import membrane protein
MRTFGYGIGVTGEGHRIPTIALALSMICHLSLFAILAYGPSSGRDRSFSPSIIDVSIVTLPTSRLASPRENVKDGETRTRIAGPKSVPKQKEAASKAAPDARKEYKRKISLKKKTFKSSTVVKNAISKIERKVEQSRAEPVARAIDSLRRTVADTKKNAGDVSEHGVPVDSDVSGAQGQRALELMDIYKAEIPYHIQNNWVFSEQLAGGRTDLVAWLVIEIRPDGTILDIWFEKRSGNRYFDEQAHKAVKKSDPLPPLPKGYSRSNFNVGLRFTPSGLK